MYGRAQSSDSLRRRQFQTEHASNERLQMTRRRTRVQRRRHDPGVRISARELVREEHVSELALPVQSRGPHLLSCVQVLHRHGCKVDLRLRVEHRGAGGGVYDADGAGWRGFGCFDEDGEELHREVVVT